MKTLALPKHIAIIMDGNGRWARKKNLPRFRGHLEGGKRVEEIISLASDLGIKVLTLFAFSTENWTRPRQEVSMIMKTVCSVLDHGVAKLQKKNVKLQVMGEKQGLPLEVLESIDRAVHSTGRNTGMILNMAFNYGARAEIVSAIRQILQAVTHGQMAAGDINEDLVSQYLYTHGLPDPDLLIRTSGEQRISNFMLWQLSYAELYFSEKFWPEFNEKEFKKAIADYQQRERRYGRISIKESKSE